MTTSLFQLIMGCGSSRSRESRPSTPTAQLPQPKAEVEVEVDVDEKNPSLEELELKLFEPESSKGLKSFKAIAFAHTSFLQKVSRPETNNS